MADIGDKFIIEIGGYYFSEIAGGYDTGHEVPEEMLDKPAKLYRVKGFNSLVFDQNGLDRLEQYIEESAAKEAYALGAEEAWECAQEIVAKTRDAIECFTYKEPIEVLQSYSGYAATRLLKFHKKKENMIRVGDEVCLPSGMTAVVIRPDTADTNATLLYPDGDLIYRTTRDCTRTGRRFPQVANLLDEMNLLPFPEEDGGE